MKLADYSVLDLSSVIELIGSDQVPNPLSANQTELRERILGAVFCDRLLPRMHLAIFAVLLEDNNVPHAEACRLVSEFVATVALIGACSVTDASKKRMLSCAERGVGDLFKLGETAPSHSPLQECAQPFTECLVGWWRVKGVDTANEGLERLVTQIRETTSRIATIAAYARYEIVFTYEIKAGQSEESPHVSLLARNLSLRVLAFAVLVKEGYQAKRSARIVEGTIAGFDTVHTSLVDVRNNNRVLYKFPIQLLSQVEAEKRDTALRAQLGAEEFTRFVNTLLCTN